MENKMFYQDGKKRFLYDYIFFETTNPIFFSCVDEKKDIYIATLCDDRKELRWILAKTSESQLMDIMKNKVTMYDVYLNSDIYYVITRKCNVTKCQLYDDKSIDKLDFPTKGEYFEADDEELADYMAHINKNNNNNIYNESFHKKKKFILQEGSIKTSHTNQDDNKDMERATIDIEYNAFNAA